MVRILSVGFVWRLEDPGEGTIRRDVPPRERPRDAVIVHDREGAAKGKRGSFQRDPEM